MLNVRRGSEGAEGSTSASTSASRWTRWVSLGVLVAAALAVAFVDLDRIEGVLRRVGPELGAWTYLVVGALAFLETAALLGLVAPGELAVIIGGVAAAQGGASLAGVAAVATSAAIAGDVASYAAGRKLGRSFLVRHGRHLWITPSAIARAEHLFARHGGKAIVIGRFVGVVRALAPFLAGVTCMRPRQFIAFDVAGAGAWAIGCTILGFVLAESLDAALAALQHAKFGVAAVLLGVALFVAGRRGWRRRRDRSIGTVGGSSHSGGE